MLSIAINVLLVIHVLVSLFIILLVLMQRPKNEGLGAAFGGGMTENLFGAQTTNVLQTTTRYLGGIFFALTLLLSWLYVKETNQRSNLQKRLLAPTVVPQLATPAPGAAAPAPDPKAVEQAVQEAIQKALQKGATPADGKKPAPAATPAPEKPAAAAPAPAESPAAKPAPPPPAPEAPKPAASAKPDAAPAQPQPAAPAAEKPATPSAGSKPAEPEKAPEKPGN